MANRVRICFDDSGNGSADIDGRYAEGVWGIAPKVVEKDGKQQSVLQLFVLVDFEINADPMKLQQSHWLLNFVDQRGHNPVNFQMFPRELPNRSDDAEEVHNVPPNDTSRNHSSPDAQNQNYQE